MRSVRLNLEGVINYCASNGRRLDRIYCVPVRLVGIDRSNSCQKSMCICRADGKYLEIE